MYERFFFVFDKPVLNAGFKDYDIQIQSNSNMYRVEGSNCPLSKFDLTP